MVNALPFMLLMGCLLGFLSGIGVGGGSLLMLWLTLILNIEHNIARCINLLFFIPSAVITSLFRWKQGSLQFRKILPAVICACLAAAVFTVFSRKLDIALLQKLFGVLLLFTGIRELFYRQRKAR